MINKINKSNKKKSLGIDYFVNHGVTSRHLFEIEQFDLLKNAKKFITKLDKNRAYELSRLETFSKWDASDAELKILDKRLI